MVGRYDIAPKSISETKLRSGVGVVCRWKTFSSHEFAHCGNGIVIVIIFGDYLALV